MQFHEKLSALRFFDPACGCGNFLVIAYRELRVLELDLLKEIFADQLSGGHRVLDVSTLSTINVDQFYGIEIGEFPVRIAEVALWMMDHIMNNRLSLQFGESYARIPIKASPHIHREDALEIDWRSVLPPDQCSFVYGNPPFVGAKYQSDAQRTQVRRIAALGGSGGTLDYVAAWFLRAAEYIQGTHARIGFVATNSITQGEQVAQLWPVLFERYGLEIAYAHRTFAWGSDARGMAHVHVVIIGLTRRADEQPLKRLFTYDDIRQDPVESSHPALTPYLFDAANLTDRHLVVEEVSKPINGAPKMIIGSKPIDGGYLIFDEDERREFLRRQRNAEPFLRPFVGATEFLYNEKRWIACLQDVSPSVIRSMPAVVEILKNVKEYRLGKIPPKAKKEERIPGISARALAETPSRFHVTVIPNRAFLAVPELTSETRNYVPIGWLEPPTVPSNLVKVVIDASLWHFGILTSRIHVAWLKFIGGRFKSDCRYSSGIVYNNFPWPQADQKQKARIESLAQNILDARAAFHSASLADLYDVDTMSPNLVHAHQALDRAVDHLYRGTAFHSDRERVEHLFALYEKLVLPPLAPAIPVGSGPVPRGRRRAAASRG